MASVNSKTFFDATAVTADVTSDAQSLDNNHREFIGWVKQANNVGGGTVDIKIQHSPNNSDWFDLVTFTQLTTNGTEAIDVTSDVFTHVRADVDVGGGFTSGDITVALSYTIHR